MSRIVSSNTPCVDGYVTMSADRFAAFAFAFASRSAMSMLPSSGLHDDDLHARHHRARRIRAVRRLRNEADVAVRVAARLVILADHEQPGVLALRAGVRLQRHRREAGDLGERRLEPLEHLAIALRLLDRRERMDLAELRPRDGIISAVAFSFIVHEPSGIIDVVSDRSLFSSRLM